MPPTQPRQATPDSSSVYGPSPRTQARHFLFLFGDRGALRTALICLIHIVVIGVMGEGRIAAARAAPRLRASASDIPALARLLESTGWTPTPELSAVFQPGHVFLPTPQGHRLQLEGCVAAPLQRSVYTGAHLVAQLQAGVRLPGARGQAGWVQELRFAAPEQRSLPALDMQATPQCAAAIARARAEGAPLDQAYVVQEALFAEVTDQRCGRLDARGRIVGAGLAGASAGLACGQVSLAPVAVAYRTLPLQSLRDPLHAPTVLRTRAERPASPCGEAEADPLHCGPVSPAQAAALHFEVGSAALSVHAGPIAAALTAAVQGQWGGHLRVEAWGDGADAIADLALAQARADAFRAAVIAAGLPAAQVIARGYPGAPPAAGQLRAHVR